MDWLSFDYKHSLDIKEAATRVAAASKELGASYQLVITKSSRRVDLEGKLLRGHLNVHYNKVSVSIALAGKVTPTRASVKAGITRALDHHFR